MKNEFGWAGALVFAFGATAAILVALLAPFLDFETRPQSEPPAQIANYPNQSQGASRLIDRDFIPEAQQGPAMGFFIFSCRCRAFLHVVVQISRIHVELDDLTH
jgi:hypothetical protein